ncbi:DUF6232 family protein [Amycolatopsis sp. lyj-109]|uniref:DUF6232 family protein n=1 Tax=Amycolatopsis sp. lyj-109 TaxID=2789287 RepID=UPI0039780645
MYVVIPTLAAMLRILYLLGVLAYGRLRSRYALIIETPGAEFTALTGRDPYELEQLKREITHAIENPPAGERVCTPAAISSSAINTGSAARTTRWWSTAPEESRRRNWTRQSRSCSRW